MRNLTCAVLVTLSLLAGCAGAPGRQATETAAERAQQRWDLLIAGDPAAAYAFLSPGAREIVSQQLYVTQQANRPVKRQRAEVISENCPENEAYCDVGVRLLVEVPPGMLPSGADRQAATAVSERWIRLGGIWYLAPDEIAR